MDMPAHQLSMSVLMTHDTANFAGNVHEGTILKLLDQVAYACAARYSACYVVTMSVDQVVFRQPIQVGELVTFLAAVNYTGASSMEVGIKVVAENIRTQEARHVNSCFFTMVAVDENRRPVPVTPLRPFTTDEKQRFAASQVRRGLRKEIALRLKQAFPPKPNRPLANLRRIDGLECRYVHLSGRSAGRWGWQQPLQCRPRQDGLPRSTSTVFGHPAEWMLPAQPEAAGQELVNRILHLLSQRNLGRTFCARINNEISALVPPAQARLEECPAASRPHGLEDGITMVLRRDPERALKRNGVDEDNLGCAWVPGFRQQTSRELSDSHTCSTVGRPWRVRVLELEFVLVRGFHDQQNGW